MFRKILGISITLSATAILLLILVALYEDPSESDNGFNRRWLSMGDTPLSSAPVGRSIFRICGATDTHYYLAGQTPKQIWVVNKEFKLADTLLLNIHVPDKLITPNQIAVDSPLVFVHLNNLTTIISSKFHSPFVDSVRLPIPVFMRSAQINDSIATLYAYVHENKNFCLFFVNLRTGVVLRKKVISPGTGISGFADDGMLLYNKKNAMLTYLHYYKNSFICMDTTANVAYYGNTIDTIVHPVVEMTQRGTSKRGEIVPANSRLTVNKKAALNNKHLIVLSGIKSRDQSVNNFRSNHVFDVYNILNGTYAGSFTLPKRKNQKIQSIYLQDSTFVVLYTNLIASYKLNI